MEDYDKVLQATNVSATANGTATEKMTIYNDSLTAAQNRLTAAIQSFAENSNISQLMIIGIDLLTKIIQLLDELLNKIPLISPILKAIGAAFAVAFGTKVIGDMVNVGKTVSAVITALTGASAAAGGLSAVMTALGGPVGIVLGLLAGIVAIAPSVASAWETMFPDAEQRIENVNNAVEEANKEVDDVKSQIKEIDDQLKEINGNEKLTLADEEQKKKLEEQKEILEDILQYKKDIAKTAKEDQKEEYGKQYSNKYLSSEVDYSKQYSYISDENAQNRASTYGGGSGQTVDYFNTENASIEQLYANLQKLREEKASLNKEDSEYGKKLSQNNALEQENITALKQKAVEIGNDISEMQELGLTNTEYYRNAVNQFNNMKLELNPSEWTQIKIADLLKTDGITEKVRKAVQDGGKESRKAIKDYSNQLAQEISGNTSLQNAFAKAFNVDVSKLSVNELASQIRIIFQQMFSDIEGDAANTLADVTSTIASAEEDLHSKTNVLAEAYKDMNKQGHITESNLKNLLKIYPELSDEVKTNNGYMSISADRLKELAQAAYNTSIDYLKAQQTMTQASIDGARETIKAIQSEITAMQILGRVTYRISKGSGVEEDKKLTDLDPTEEQDLNNYLNARSAEQDKLNAEIEQWMKDIDTYQQEIDNLLNGSSTWNPQSSSSSSGGSKKTPQELALDAAKDQYNLDKLALETKKQELDIIKSQYEAIKDTYNIEKDRLNNEKDIVEQHQKELKAQLEDYKDAQDVMSDLIDLTEKKLKQQYENEKTRLSNIKDYIGEIQDAVDGVKDNYEAVIDAAKEKLKLDKKAEENQKKITDKAKNIADIQRQLMELEFNNSSDAQAQKAELLSKLNDAQSDLQDEQKSQAYDQAEQALDDAKTKLDSVFDQIDAAIDGVENVIDKYINYIGDVLMEDGNLATQALKQVDDMISGANPTLLNELYDFNNKYGDHLESTVENAYKKAFDAVQKYASETDGTFTGTYKYLGGEINTTQDAIDLDDKIIADIEKDIFDTEQKINEVETKIAEVETKISNVEIEMDKRELEYKKQQLDIQGKSYDSDPDLQALQQKVDAATAALNTNTSATDNNTQKTYEDINEERRLKLGIADNTKATKDDADANEQNSLDTQQNSNALNTNTNAVDKNTGAQATGGTTYGSSNLLSYINLSTGSVDWAGLGGSLFNMGLNAMQSPSFWTGAIDLISSLLSGTLFSAHEGTNYVQKANSWLDDMLGLGENETARVLEVGEQVIPKGEEVNLAQYDTPYSNANYGMHYPSISSSSTSGDVNIDMGDITASGIDVSALEDFLNGKKSEIANYVYSQINKQVKISGHRNVRNKW